MIEVSHLSKSYRGRVAVQDVSFSVERGTICGLLGPNGAGKSTTMNIMAGCLAASAGTVRYDGLEIYENMAQVKRKIGYLPELPPLYPEMTVVEYLHFVGRAKGLSSGEADAACAVLQGGCGLVEVGDRLIRNLSKGYRQRVGIAEALVGNPDFVIFDEPTVGLDPIQIVEIRDLIHQLAGTRTVLISSHILSEIRTLCDRIVMIAHGHVVADDTPEALERRFSNRRDVVIEVRAGERQLRRALSSVVKMENVEIGPGEASGELRATVSLPATRDDRAELSRALVEEGIPLLEFTTKRVSLEDVFIELVEKGGRMLAIFRRDLRSFAVTMTGWVFVAFMLVFIGIYMMVYNLNYGYGNFEYVLTSLTFVYLIAVPLVTMRCFAEERRQGTDQLLYALPLSSGKIVLGKYLAMLVVLAVPLLVSCCYPLMLAQFGDVYLPTAYASILGFFFLGAGLTAIDMFVSSLCESQVTAAVACFAILLVDYFLTSLASFMPSGAFGTVCVLTVLIVLCVVGLMALTKNGVFSVAIGAAAEIALIAVGIFNGSALEGLVPDILSGLSLFDRYNSFVNGVFDLTAIVFYLAVCASFSFLTVNAFDARRWS